MRIVAGTSKGHRLKAPRSAATRPTQDKVREALFSRIFQLVPEAMVLELFAGSGAIGLEALSRGAKHAVMVDDSNAACSTMKDNARSTKLEDRCQIVATSADAFLRTNRSTFDLVIADPPYHREETSEDYVKGLLENDQLNDALVDDGLLVIETHANYRLDLPPAWRLHDDRSYGKSRLWFLFKQPATTGESEPS